MTLETLSTARSFGGTQGVYRHASRETGTDMVFAVYLPPQAEAGDPLPVLWYLSGLTCTHANVMEKGGYQRVCAELGLILVAPDTSPRGADVPDDAAYDFGQGAGFYVDATEAPLRRNYRMYSYLTGELPDLIAADFPGRHDPPGDHRPFDGRPWRAHPRFAPSRPLPKRLRLRPDRRARPGAVGRESAWPPISAPTAPPGARTTPSR